MAYYKILSDTLTAIADAIRAKAGTTAQITPSNMSAAIDLIETAEAYDGSVTVE